MRLLQICVVVIESIFNNKPTFFIEFFADLIYHMHMQVYGDCLRIIPNLFLKLLHHLIPNSISSVWLKNTKSENVGMLLLIKLLDPDSIGSDDNIIIIAESGEISILECDFDVEWSAILDRKSLKVDFPQHIDILIMDISKCNLNLFFCLCSHRQSL